MDKSKQRSILFISALDIWSMGDKKGAQSLWVTLKGYADRGWKVYYVTSNKGEDSVYDVHKNIEVIRFDYPLIKSFMKIKKIGFLANILFWALFQFTAFWESVMLKRQYGTKFSGVYAYEFTAVPVGKVLSKLWNLPLISRFQGTKLISWLDRPFWKLRRWDHVFGYIIPSDLVIMTNDGTQGKQIYQKINKRINKFKFWMNGVSECPEGLYLSNEYKKQGLEAGKKNTLLMVNRLVGWKRIDRAIKALPRVISKFPDTILVLVGDGPERGSLEELALKKDVRENVVFIGSVPHEDVWQFYKYSDIFLSLNEMSNVGNPLLEAMRCGSCIITLDNGDTGKLIQNGKTGVLLEPEKLDKLSKKINKLLGNPEMRQSLAASAKKFADDRFWTWEERMDKEVGVVNELLNTG